MQITVGGGLESISLVQTNAVNRSRAQDPELLAHVPGALHDDDRDGGTGRRSLQHFARGAG